MDETEERNERRGGMKVRGGGVNKGIRNKHMGGGDFEIRKGSKGRLRRKLWVWIEE